ncbi:MAG: hypothetical protein ACXIU8_01585 [Alkalilacustris sp.]
MPRVLSVIGLLLLAGCATPFERCLAPATAQLRTVERLIAETEGNIARGFAWEPVREVSYDLVPCRDQLDGPIRFCRVPFVSESRRAVAIDRTVEAGKLASLRGRRSELHAALVALEGDCRARFPAD